MAFCGKNDDSQVDTVDDCMMVLHKMMDKHGGMSLDTIRAYEKRMGVPLRQPSVALTRRESCESDEFSVENNDDWTINAVVC